MSTERSGEWLAWVDRFLPERSLAPDATARMRQRLLIAFGLLVSAVTLPWYAAMILQDPVLRAPRAIALLAITLLAANPLWLRFASPRHVAGLTLFLLHFAILSNIVLNGGLTGPVALAITCLPVLTGVLWGHRAGWLDMILMVIAAAVIDHVGRHYGLPTAAIPTLWPLVRIMTLAISLGMMMLALSAYSELSLRQAQELAAARDTALNASRAKSRFLSSMSHELRTPMVGVVGAAELLMRGEHTPAQAKLLRSLQKSANAQLELIGDVLDISRIESDRLELELAAIMPRQILEEIGSVFRLACTTKGLDLVLEMPENLPEWVETDGLRLRQILSNLVSNALKFTHEGSVTVRTRVVGEGDETRLRFQVRDTGIGFESHKAEQLFEAFRQADGSTTRKYGGSGLGLSICRHLVQALGGTIQAQSSPGEGACFTFELPAPVREGPPPGSTEVVVRSRRGLNVLLADDEPVNRFILSSMLAELGHGVIEVENGRQAVDQVLAEDIDVMVLDMHMPELDGPACAKEVRALPSDKSEIAILGLTADAVIENRPLYLESGIDALFSKPIEIDTLASALLQTMNMAYQRSEQA